MENTIEVEIEVSGILTYELTEDDIKRIAEDYKGDHLSYIKDSTHISNYDIEYDIEDYTYSTRAVEEELIRYRKENELDDDFCIPYAVAKERFVEACEITTSILEEICENTQKQELERTNELQALMEIADYQNPKLELNDVYFDEEYIVATDTRRMMVTKNTTAIKDVYIPKAFLELFVYDTGKHLEVRGQDVLLTANNRHFYYYPTHLKNYPDYDRIIPKEINTKISNESFLKDSKVLLADELDHHRDLRIIKIDGKTLCLNNDFIIEDFNFDTFCFNEPNLPVMFESETSRYIVMPIILSEDDKELIAKINKALT